MAKLNEIQLDFLKSQNILPSNVFDATGLSKPQRINLMDSLELSFYFGGAPCNKAGHTLRTKAGHCIQCDTSKIAYQLRHLAAGFIYIAYSINKNLIKIGTTKNPPIIRIEVLNTEAYGNTRDWTLQKYKEIKKDMGKIEFSIHSELSNYSKIITYEKSRGVFVECRELFACGVMKANEVFEKHTSN